MAQEIRVRFAPSPTGALHIGGVRTALYNYLYARKNKGTFILRIEDTDQSRFVPGAEDYIRESLAWLGITPDEGVVEGGEYGPYRQSERKDIYMKYARQLLDEGNAYYAFDTPEELDAMRERLKAAKVANPVYDSITRMSMKNSLTLSEDEVKQKISAGEPYVIRLKVPRKEEVRLNDLVRGWVLVNSANIDDKILVKSDGMPTYHLANVVDDHLMKISHVIRGEEWLPSAPLHVLLYRFLGWEDSMPRFAHLPLLLKPDGNGKLSKRDADKKGYPVFPLDWTEPDSGEFSMGFREAGYLPDALVNFLALLGWNPGTEQELFSMGELIESFSLERINKAGAKFDIEKAKWFNQQYIKAKTDAELAGYLLTALKDTTHTCSQEKAEEICRLMKERVTFPAELYTTARYFFEDPVEYDEKIVSKRWNDDTITFINAFREKLQQEDNIDEESLHKLLNEVAAETGIGLGKVMQAMRLVITGVGGGPDLTGVMKIIEKDAVIRRIDNAMNALKVS